MIFESYKYKACSLYNIHRLRTAYLSLLVIGCSQSHGFGFTLATQCAGLEFKQSLSNSHKAYLSSICFKQGRGRVLQAFLFPFGLDVVFLHPPLNKFLLQNTSDRLKCGLIINRHLRDYSSRCCFFASENGLTTHTEK